MRCAYSGKALVFSAFVVNLLLPKSHRYSCYAGFALAFFRVLAAKATTDQQASFAKSIADDWEQANEQEAPRGRWPIWAPVLFGKKQSKQESLSTDQTRVLCLCLTAFMSDTTSQVGMRRNCCKECLCPLTHQQNLPRRVWTSQT